MAELAVLRCFFVTTARGSVLVDSSALYLIMVHGPASVSFAAICVSRLGVGLVCW